MRAPTGTLAPSSGQSRATRSWASTARVGSRLASPVAHSTSSFAAARAFSGLLPAGPLYCAATAMAISRLYLGVHYPSDVAAGAGLGTLLGSFGR